MKQNSMANILKINLTLVFTAIIVGFIISIVAQFFALTAKWIFNLIQSNNDFEFFQILIFDQNINFLPLLACISASVLVSLLIKYQNIDRWHGPADTIYAAHQLGGTLDIKKGFLSTLATFFSISGGASVGIYGPLVHFGGTLGAFFRRKVFRSNIPHDIIIGAGVAAAISAGFGSPIAGIVFAHEVILRHFSMRALASISLASVIASFTAKEMNLVSPALRFEQINFELLHALPGLLTSGLISALVAYIFMKSLLFSTKISNASNIPFYLRPLIPGFLCGICGIFLPEAIGLGSETIVNVITENNTFVFLLIILVMKIFLSSSCVGFGLFGGIFSPALLIGVCTGALLFHLPFLGTEMNLHAVLAVSGMAAVASSVIGGPITAIILIFELTGSYDYAIASILPIGLCNLITYIIFGSSFFDAQLKLRNIPMGYGREHILMNQTQISDYTSHDFVKFDTNISIKAAIKKFKINEATEGYFVDKSMNYLGKLKIIDVINLQKTETNAFKFKLKKHIKLTPDTNILKAIKVLTNFVGESIPIVNNKNIIVGIISENDVLKAYTQISEKIRSIEKN